MSKSAITAQDALAIVRPRAQAKHGKFYPGARAMFDEAQDLWDEERASYRALVNVGLRDAAECAWVRRGAAESLCQILVTAL
jgi:hypothetical protein